MSSEEDDSSQVLSNFSSSVPTAEEALNAVSSALALGPGERLRSACALASLALEGQNEQVRLQAVLLSTKGIPLLLRTGMGKSDLYVAKSEPMITLAKSVAALLRLEQAALSHAFSPSQLDTTDAIQAWSDAHVFSIGRLEDQDRVAVVKRAIKMHIIACLEAWCSNAPKTLFSHLSLLLASFDFTTAASRSQGSAQSALDGKIGRTNWRAGGQTRTQLNLLAMSLNDPSSSIRLAATQCVKNLLLAAHTGKYLQLADESASDRAYAFTSLSAQVASVLLAIRAATAAGVQRTTQGPVKLGLAYLDLAEVLLTKVSKARLRVPHSTVLAPILARTVQHATPVLAVRAWELLKLIGCEDVRPEIPATAVADALSHINNLAPEDAIDDWVFLTAVAKAVEVWTLDQKEQLAICTAEHSPHPLALGALLGALRAQWPFSRASMARQAIKAVQACLSSSTLLEAQRVAGSCAAHLLLTYQTTTDECLAAIRTLTSPSSPASVRAATFHTIGEQVHSFLQSAVPLPPSFYRSISFAWELLWSYKDEVSSIPKNSNPDLFEMAAQLTWSLANLAEHVTDPEVLAPVATWTTLPERVGINAVRMLGVLLAQIPPLLVAAKYREVQMALAALATAASARTPKMRWNAAAAFQRALTSSELDSHVDLVRVRQALASNVAAGAHAKVVKASSAALRALPAAQWLDERAQQQVEQAVAQGSERLRGWMATAASPTNRSAAAGALAELDALLATIKAVHATASSAGATPA